jgi:hypothetical protein
MDKKYTQPQLNQMMETVDSILMSLLGSNVLIDKWWTNQNIALGLKTPLEEWYEGDPDKVYRYVINAVNYGGH